MDEQDALLSRRAVEPGRKAEKPRKVGNPPAAVKVLIALLIPVALVWAYKHGQGSDGPKTHSEQISRSSFHGTWPLAVDNAWLNCTNGQITVDVGKTTYAVNGAAVAGGTAQQLDSIWTNDPANPGLKISLTDLLAEGQKLC